MSEEQEVRSCEASTNISVSRETLNEILCRPLTPGTPLRRTSKTSDLSFRLDSEISVTKKVAEWNNANNNVVNPVLPIPVVVNMAKVKDNDSCSDSSSSAGSPVTVREAPTTAASARAPPPPSTAKLGSPEPAAAAGDQKYIKPPPLQPKELTPGIQEPIQEQPMESLVVSQVNTDPLKGLGDGKNVSSKNTSKAKKKKKKSNSRNKSIISGSKSKKSHGGTNTTGDSSSYNMDVDVDVTTSYDDSTESTEKSSGDSHQHKKKGCKDGELTLCKGMGAISFKVPGKITHKTTIKIAHYPQPGCEIKNPDPQEYDCEELVIHENAGTGKCRPAPACAPGPCTPKPCGPSSCAPMPCGPMPCAPMQCAPMPCPPMPCAPCDPGSIPLPPGTYANNCNYYALSEAAKQQQQQQIQYQAYQQQCAQAQAMYNPYYPNNQYCYRR